MPSGKTSTVERIVHVRLATLKKHSPPARTTLTLTDEIDISRRDMLVRPKNVPKAERLFEAMVVWMHDEPLAAGRHYMLKVGTQSVPAEAAAVRYRVDINTLKQTEPTLVNGQPGLELNAVGRDIFLKPIARSSFDPYRKNRATGEFHHHRPRHVNVPWLALAA